MLVPNVFCREREASVAVERRELEKEEWAGSNDYFPLSLEIGKRKNVNSA